MIKTHVNAVNKNTGVETPIGWCYFPEVPIILPPFDPTKGPPGHPAQPQAIPVVYRIQGRVFYILGYRWESPHLGENPEGVIPEAYLFLAVQEVEQAVKPQLLRAGGEALAVLDAAGMKPSKRN